MKGESCTEVLAVLSHMEEEYQYKVPERLINLLKTHQAPHYQFELDMSIPFSQQPLSDETLAMLALIDLNYWCKDDIEKQNLLHHYEENSRKASMSKKLAYRDVLKSLNKRDSSPVKIEPQEEIENLPLAKEETMWEKVLGFLKNQPFCMKVVGTVKNLFHIE